MVDSLLPNNCGRTTLQRTRPPSWESPFYLLHGLVSFQRKWSKWLAVWRKLLNRILKLAAWEKKVFGTRRTNECLLYRSPLCRDTYHSASSQAEGFASFSFLIKEGGQFLVHEAIHVFFCFPVLDSLSQKYLPHAQLFLCLSEDCC